MQALFFTQHGGPEVMQYGNLPAPTPGPGEALVRVRAVALNHLDLWVRRGGPAFERLPKPHVGGADVAGIVVGYGAGATGPSIGTRVAVDPGVLTGEDAWTQRGEDSLSPHYHILGEEAWGGCAEYVTVPARNLLPIPAHAGFAQAAAPCLVFLTAWRMLVKRAQVQAGETVAIVGAGGGVNSAAIQICKHLGATVYAITSTPEKMDKARQLGADHVINYKTEDWSRAVFIATGKRGVDVVVDNVGAPTWTPSIRALARGGRLVTVGGTGGPSVEMDLRLVFRKQISILGSTMGSRQDFREMMGLIFDGKLVPVIDRVMPLAEGRAAHELLERGAQFGKVVLEPPGGNG
jgi:NADPH:quinone reductase-like Zn-dependent oxidoreductase